MSDEKVLCSICGREFKDRAGLSGHYRFKHPDESMPTEQDTLQNVKTGTTAISKKQQFPLEVLIRDLELPSLVDGQAKIFDAGVQYGIKSVLVGVRVAQELSAMGVQQASPIISMAKEMRESESNSAKIVASELAEATLEANKEILNALNNLNITSKASSENPAQRMIGMIQSIPQMIQAMNMLMSMFGAKTQSQGQQQLQFGSAQKPQTATDKEIEEAFGYGESD
jgi:hypothetical protein